MEFIMNIECRNKFCFHNYPIRFYCNCRIADRKGSAAFINECRKNKEFKEDKLNRLKKDYEKAVKEADDFIKEYQRKGY
jgi:hypothetical protein